ncbi:MAG: hypothetical protein J0L65_06205 [Xanthomonadales bacterium]|jgi:hypothetical protein|nr:hypothetical protein [Xanthomonadales bacterium]
MAAKLARRFCFALCIGSLCGSSLAADQKFLTRLADVTAEGNFVKQYTEDLQRVGLEPLDTRTGVERYRFEVVPSFSKAVLIDLQVLPDGGADATAYEVPWETEPNLVAKATSQRLSRRQLKVFRRLLQRGEFWTRYHFGWGHGLDTREWIFEGVRGTQHQFFSTAEEVPKHMELAGAYLFRTVVGGEIPR